MKTNILIMIVIAIICSSCSESHFINNKAYREQVEKDFNNRKEIAAGRSEELFSVFNEDISTEEKEALQFLYAYMPLSDLADYDGSYFLNQVRYSFKAQVYFNWGKSIPEDIFRHYVLVYRVNNENLDTARAYIFNELKERIKGMSMYDAALEVNHWCHEKVTYRPSDGRTSSPLATIRTGLGRCGEESTLTVTAMRAVGIPARQCYTPRWAHTDDNHAWVEVWVDGKWYFLGACEPDPELDMGWFAIPSTRTMMVHSNAFGKYNGNEEVTYQTNLFSRVNMLPNYTATKKIRVKVVLPDTTQVVPNAEVKFKLYNYAEYYPIAKQLTNNEGFAELTTGMGDLLIWASKDNTFGYQKIDVRAQDEITIILNRKGTPDPMPNWTPNQPHPTDSALEYIEFFEMRPPVEKHNIVEASKEKIALNNQRLQYEDSLRNAYLETFMSNEEAATIKNENLTTEEIVQFIHKSEGNYAEIKTFMLSNSTKEEGLYLKEFLNSLSDKDLRDAPAHILQQHITHYQPADYPLEVYIKGIIPARISNEGLKPWRPYLKEKLNSEVGNDKTVKTIIEWIKKNITIDNEANYFNCPISPRGVFDLRIADQHSRDIFFVAACRALNIPAYLDNATGQLFAFEAGEWKIITFEEATQKNETATLILTHKPQNELKLEYWIHYTIAKYENGDFVTFDYENDPRVANFPITLELESGYYMLSTGIRYSDGTVLSRLEFFYLYPQEKLSKEIIIRDLEARNEFYGNIDLSYKIKFNNSETTVSELVKDNKMVLCFIDPTREPTKHLFKDINLLKSQFEKWGGNMVFAVATDKMAADFNFNTWKLPKNAICIEDIDGKWFNNIMTSTDQYFRDNYPVVFIVDKKGGLTFKTEGYRIGTGELIFKSL